MFPFKYSPILFILLLISITGFTKAPESMRENILDGQLSNKERKLHLNSKRLPLAEEKNNKYPFSHTVQISDSYRGQVQNEELHLDFYPHSLDFLTGNFHSIHFSTQGTYFLPVGITELETSAHYKASPSLSLLLFDDNQQNLSIAYNGIYENTPYITKIDNYVRGSLCLTQVSQKELNPFFRTYRTSPLDSRTQSTPLAQRSRKYKELVYAQAKKYKLSPSLIFAIMHVESGFNPGAVSGKDAHGLMQVVISTAGADVHEYLGKKGPIPPDILHNPAVNILYGTTYLHLLNSRHWHKIQNSTSREYCIIAAYNGGSSRVLKLFGEGEQAYRMINSLSPNAVYNRIRTQFPSPETRNFITKVVRAKRNY